MDALAELSEAVSQVGSYDPFELDQLVGEHLDGDIWAYVGDHELEDRRWSKSVWEIYRHLPSDGLFAVEWEQGLTESQEDEHFGVVFAVVAESVQTTAYGKVA